MNKIKILVISGLMFFSGTYLTAAQENKALTGQTASARIVAPLILSLTLNSKLDFGTLVKTSTTANGTAVLDPIAANSATLRTLTDLGALGAIGLNKGSVPEYSLSGEVGLTYKISLPTTDVVVTNTVLAGASAASNEKMNVSDFTYAFSAGGLATPNAATKIDAETETSLKIATTNTFQVGATLTVDKLQATGTYSGSYTISVQYE
tara:strand:+ start:3394 stop:4014 length:621 start_codon:yes stop_codon:yes gene_type:complete